MTGIQVYGNGMRLIGAVREGYAECQNRFDYDKFISHYDGLSEDEWCDVIREAEEMGYDIRSVLYYKKEYGDDFTIENLLEIVNPLLAMDGANTFLQLGPIHYDYLKPMQEEISERYARWGLPIPEYWKLRLWFDSPAANMSDGQS